MRVRSNHQSCIAAKSPPESDVLSLAELLRPPMRKLGPCDLSLNGYNYDRALIKKMLPGLSKLSRWSRDGGIGKSVVAASPPHRELIDKQQQRSPAWRKR